MALFGNVCAALHNICIKFKVPMYTEKDFNIESVTMEVETSNHTQPNNETKSKHHCTNLCKNKYFIKKINKNKTNSINTF